MPPPPAETVASPAFVPSVNFFRHSTFGLRHFAAREMVPSETRPADAFLPIPVCRHDHSRAARSNARAFHKAAADFGARFQITRIAVTQAGLVARSTRLQ